MPGNIKEQLRQDTTRILQLAKVPAKNISKEEIIALKELRNNENLTILSADKGNATVVLDTSDYRKKMEAFINDPAYKISVNDPTTYLEKKTAELIKSTSLDPEIKKAIIPCMNSSRVPRFYGVPKTHKSGIPLRPILSAFGSPTHATAKHCAKKLQPRTEEAKSYIKNSTHFVKLLQNLRANDDDLLVSFDVVSLFTKVPIPETLEIIRSESMVNNDTLKLIKHCMESTYFIYEGKYYKQVEGAPMGSPLSPAMANIFMEDLEEKVLETSVYKPSCWFRYLDDTFVIWPHGKDALDDFLVHLNTAHSSIKFTMEIEENGKLPFLDVLVKRKEDGSLGHSVYRKPTHTNRYLNANSHHHPSQIASVAYTLAIRSQRISDEDSAPAEKTYLEKALRENGFSKKVIEKAFSRKPNVEQTDLLAISSDEKPEGWAFLPYVRGTTDKISKILRQHNIKTIFDTDTKIERYLSSIKDKIHLDGKGIYEIPCKDCTGVYIGETGRRISNRVIEHRNCLRRDEKTSALVQHERKHSHQVDLQEAKVIAPVSNHRQRIIREAIEIEKRPHNFNKRDDSLRLPSAWKPIVERCTVPERDMKCDPGRRSMLPAVEDTSNARSLTPPTRVLRSSARSATNIP